METGDQHNKLTHLDEQKNKEDERLNLLKHLFLKFKEAYKEDENDFEYVQDIDTIVEEINKYYWDFIIFIKEEKYVTKKDASQETRLNIYKIISATEHAIIKFQPIKQNRILNAELASWVSIYLYRIWFEKDLNTVSFGTPELQEIWEKFIEDRRIWLANFNTSTEFPFFLNSQLWMLIDMVTRNSIKN